MRSNLGRSFRSDGWKLIPPGIKNRSRSKNLLFSLLTSSDSSPSAAAACAGAAGVRPTAAQDTGPQHAPPGCSPRAGIAPPPPHGLHQVVTGHIGPMPAAWGSSAAAGPRSAGRRLLMRRCCMCHARRPGLSHEHRAFDRGLHRPPLQPDAARVCPGGCAGGRRCLMQRAPRVRPGVAPGGLGRTGWHRVLPRVSPEGSAS